MKPISFLFCLILFGFCEISSARAGVISDYFNSLTQKAAELKRLAQDNEKLKRENAHLRILVESQSETQKETLAEATTQKSVEHAQGAQQSKLAKLMESIRYPIPDHLLPEQLHALGVYYFSIKDYEKSAVILNEILEVRKDVRYQDASTFLALGISAYRIENYTFARAIFDRILKDPEIKNRDIKTKSALWSALTFKRLNQPLEAQKSLITALAINPKAPEMKWVNRGIASVMEEPETETDQEEEEHEVHGH